MNVDQMQALVASCQARIKRSWLAMVAHLRQVNTEAALEEQIRRFDTASLTDVRSTATLFASDHTAGYVHAGQETARWIASQLRKDAGVRKAMPTFDAADLPAAQWAAQNRLDLVAEIDDETKAMLREALSQGAKAGLNPREVAQEIREFIGLTSHQVGVVNNYRRLLEEGQYAAALRRELSSGHSDRAIAAAMTSGRTLNKAQVDTAVERYRANMVARRAEDIARTEGLRVAHQGSEELYRQAVARGDLDASEIQRSWNWSPGRKGSKYERVFHRVMHGQTVGYGEKFVSGLGAELRYPGDPEADGEETINCACCLSTRIVPGEARSADRPSLTGDDEEPADLEGESEASDVGLDDEEALADEDVSAEETEAAADEADLADEAGADDLEADDSAIDDLTPEDLASLLDADIPDSGPELTDAQRNHQRILDQMQAVADQRAAVQQAESDLADAKAGHDELKADLDRLIETTPPSDWPAVFRTGVSHGVAVGSDQDEVINWVEVHRAAIERGKAKSSAK